MKKIKKALIKFWNKFSLIFVVIAGIAVFIIFKFILKKDPQLSKIMNSIKKTININENIISDIDKTLDDGKEVITGIDLSKSERDKKANEFFKD